VGTLSWQGLKEIAWRELSQPKYWISQAGVPLGTKAADVPSGIGSVNYDQCFVRDFVPVALIYLIKREEVATGGEAGTISTVQIVGNFLAAILQMQITPELTKHLGRSPGMMPASFKVEQEQLKPDYGELAIAQVTPVDSCLWWLILLRAYYRACIEHGDPLHPALFAGHAPQPKLRRAIRLLLSLYLSHRFDNEPMLLVPDGAGMVDRRMGFNGYPLEIQALFYAGLQAAQDFLRPEESSQARVRHRLHHLQKQLCDHYWLDLRRLRMLYQAQSEQYGEPNYPNYTVSAEQTELQELFFNRYNLYPESIPFERLIQWLPEQAGYLVGNLGPSQLDCRFLAIGNLVAVFSNLMPPHQAWSVMNLIYTRRTDLLGDMPMKVSYPALEDEEWRMLTGCDPKNKPWSYHNGGSWPMLTWMLAAAALSVKHHSLLEQLREDIMRAGRRLVQDRWPEYYDGSNGRLIGQMARRYQTWSIAGLLLAQELLDQPQHLALIHPGEPSYDP
jgi:hypothetical protein